MSIHLEEVDRGNDPDGRKFTDLVESDTSARICGARSEDRSLIVIDRLGMSTIDLARVITLMLEN